MPEELDGINEKAGESIKSKAMGSGTIDAQESKVSKSRRNQPFLNYDELPRSSGLDQYFDVDKIKNSYGSICKLLWVCLSIIFIKRVKIF